MRKLNILFLLLSLCLVLFLTSCSGKKVELKPEQGQINHICKLSTIEAYYHNIVKKTIPAGKGLFNIGEKERKLWFEYTTKAKIGIDVNKVVIEINGNKVNITLPKADVIGKPEIIKETFNNDSFVVSADGFNKNEITVDQQKEALSEAQNTMLKTVKSNEALFVKAQNRAKVLIENYINQLSKYTEKPIEIEWNLLGE